MVMIKPVRHLTGAIIMLTPVDHRLGLNTRREVPLWDDSLATAQLTPASTAIGWGFLFLESTLYSLAVPNPPPDAHSIEPQILVSLKLGGD
jgi:hypothetical protein